MNTYIFSILLSIILTFNHALATESYNEQRCSLADLSTDIPSDIFEVIAGEKDELTMLYNEAEELVEAVSGVGLIQKCYVEGLEEIKNRLIRAHPKYRSNNSDGLTSWPVSEFWAYHKTQLDSVRFLEPRTLCLLVNRWAELLGWDKFQINEGDLAHIPFANPLEHAKDFPKKFERSIFPGYGKPKTFFSTTQKEELCQIAKNLHELIDQRSGVIFPGQSPAYVKVCFDVLNSNQKKADYSFLIPFSGSPGVSNTRRNFGMNFHGKNYLMEENRKFFQQIMTDDHLRPIEELAKLDKLWVVDFMGNGCSAFSLIRELVALFRINGLAIPNFQLVQINGSDKTSNAMSYIKQRLDIPFHKLPFDSSINFVDKVEGKARIMPPFPAAFWREDCYRTLKATYPSTFAKSIVADLTDFARKIYK